MQKPNTVAIELKSAHWGGGYIANINAVRSLLTDYPSSRKREAMRS